MKKLILIYTLLITTLIFSSPSNADWVKVGESLKGNAVYVDFERIRKVDGYIYFWNLLDRVKPTETKVLSSKVYIQADCRLFRYKNLVYHFHKEPMGRGPSNVSEPVKEGWRYPSPGSLKEIILKSVCS